MSTCVCIHRWQKPNEFVPSKDLESKTAAQIKDYLKAKDEILLISTPLYRKPLEPDTVPLNEYKQLILIEGKTLSKYPPTNFNLTILPKTNLNTNSLTFSIKTQFTEHTFPEMSVDYNPNSCKTVSDLIPLASKLFNIGCEDAKFFKSENDNETDLDSNYSVSEMLDLSINQIKSNQTTPLFTFSCKIPDDTLSNISKRCQISSEVISSEESFVADLFQLDQFYKKRITNSKIFDKIQLKFIFRDVPCIVDTHKRLLGELKRITVNYASEFGPVFLNFVDSFKVSLSFISNYNAVDEMIKNKLTRSDALARFREIEDQNESGKTFMSYYITPVQRYPRYPLLIRDLLKYTPDFHPDKPYLAKALNEIDSANKSLDQAAHKIKQLVEIEEIEKITNHCIAEDGREFVIQKPVKISKPKNQSGILYLFNDIVFLAIKTKKGQSIIFGDDNNQFIQVTEFQFCNGRPTADSIIANIFQKEYVLTFESYSEKSVWMDSFNKVRTNQLSNINDKNKFAKWTDIEMGEQIYPLSGHDGILFKKRAYFTGGMNQNNAYNTNVIIYDIDNDKWSSQDASSLPQRSFHTMIPYKDYMYVLFGQGPKNILGDIWRSQGGDWSKVAAPTTNLRYGHTTVLYNDKFYIFGGRNGEKLLNDVLIFNPEKNEFKHVKPAEGSKTPSGRYYHSATVYHDEMIIYGGKTSKGVSSDMYSFNFTTKEWKQFSDIKLKSRFSHKSVVLSQDYLFIIGGFQKNYMPANTVVISLEDNKILTDFTEYGNIPFYVSKFAFVQLTENRALLYGGVDSASKVPFSSSYIIDTEEGFDSEREYVEVKPKSRDRIKYSIGLSTNNSDSENSTTPEIKAKSNTRSTNDLADTDKKKIEEDQKNSRNSVQLGTHSQNELMAELQKNKLFKEKDKKRSLKNSQEEACSSPDLTRCESVKSVSSSSHFKTHSSKKSILNPSDDHDIPNMKKKHLETSQDKRKRANTVVPSLSSNYTNETKSSDSSNNDETDNNDETENSDNNETEKIEETEKEKEKEEEEEEKIEEIEKEEENEKIEETEKAEESEKIIEPETPKTEKRDVNARNSYSSANEKKQVSTCTPLDHPSAHSCSSHPLPPSKLDIKSPPLRSISRPPVQSAILKNSSPVQSDFVPDPDIKLSSTFNENDFCRKFGIDISELSLLQRQQMVMKAKNAFNLFIENEGLENQIKSFKKNGSLVLKVSDVSKKTHILYFSAEDAFDAILQKINQVLGKEISTDDLVIQLPNDTATELSKESFEEKKSKMIDENLPYLKVVEN